MDVVLVLRCRVGITATKIRADLGTKCQCDKKHGADLLCDNFLLPDGS